MPRYCKNCGKQLGFLSSLLVEDSLCSRECKIAYETKIAEEKNKRAADLSKLEDQIVETKNLTDQQVEIYRRYDKHSLLNSYSRIYQRFVIDKELDEQEIKTLALIQQTFGLTNQDVNWDDHVRPFVYVNALRKEGELPSVNLQIDDGSRLVLRKGEIVHFGDIATLKELRSVSLGYSGGSRGVSFRIMKGVNYRIGSHSGHIEKEDRFVEISRGALVLTNQRLFLHPLPQRKAVSIPLNKIQSYRCFENGIEVYKEGREKSYFFSIAKSGSVELFGLCLGHLLGQ